MLLMRLVYFIGDTRELTDTKCGLMFFSLIQNLNKTNTGLYIREQKLFNAYLV